MTEKMKISDEKRIMIIQEIIKQIDFSLKKRDEIDVPKLASISYDVVVDVINNKNFNCDNSDDT